MTDEEKINLVKSLIQSGLDEMDDLFEQSLFNPFTKSDRFHNVHPSHKMVGVGEPGTMGWEGYACNKCWAREGTLEANAKCNH